MSDAVNDERREGEGVQDDLDAIEGADRPVKRRGPILSILMILLSGGMMVWFFSDAMYFFRIGKPEDLGDASEIDPGRLRNNTYVRIHGFPWEANTISYEQGIKLTAFDRNRHAFFPLLGQRAVFVKLDLPDYDKTTELPGVFEGRLLQVRHVGPNYKKVFRYLNRNRGVFITEDSWVLFDGDTPGEKWWALLLDVLFLFFIVNNVRILVLYVRRMREM